MNAAYDKMKTLVVLGMHRSATSLVAKGLHHEAFMGHDLMPANVGNPQGYFESLAIVRLNDKILQAAGGNWKQPPTRERLMQVKQQFDAEIQRTVQAHYRQAQQAGFNICGFKDPRTTLTAWLWHPHLANPHYVCVWRKPEDIAQSLHQRDGMPIAQGMQLANHYQTEMKHFLQSR